MTDAPVGVGEALRELREMWPEGSFKIVASSGLPRYHVLVLRQPHLSVHQPTAEGATLDDCMVELRQWRNEIQPQLERKQRDALGR